MTLYRPLICVFGASLLLYGRTWPVFWGFGRLYRFACPCFDCSLGRTRSPRRLLGFLCAYSAGSTAVFDVLHGRTALPGCFWTLLRCVWTLRRQQQAFPRMFLDFPACQ